MPDPSTLVDAIDNLEETHPEVYEYLNEEHDIDEELEKAQWPKTTTLYLHDKNVEDHNRAIKLGMEEDSEPYTLYRAITYELGVNVTFYEDGRASVNHVEINGKELEVEGEGWIHHD